MKRPKKRPARSRPEDVLSDELRAHMKLRGWHTEKTHGSMFQAGWPDLYCMHPNYGTRWVETKRPGTKSKLTPSQIAKFTRWGKYGVKVWILTGKKDYERLFGPPNWYMWMDGNMKGNI